MSVPLFSIIVPVYNKEDYLHECVESVLNQTCSDFELILVDDGSTDLSSDICDKYAASDSRIKVVHKENGGLVSARKAGAQLASGKYVFNIDSDDYIVERALDTLKNVIDKYKPDIVGFKFSRFNDAGVINLGGYTVENGFYDSSKMVKIKQVFLYNPEKRFFSFSVGPSLCFNVIKTSIYVKWQLATSDLIIMGEDLSVFAPCLLEANSMYLADEPLYLYRIYSDSITSTYRGNEFDNLSLLANYLRNNAMCSKYDIKYQLSSYITFRIFEILIGIASNSKDYYSFKSEVSKLPSSLWNCVRKFKAVKHGLKSFLVPFSIRHKLWFLYWFMYHKK